MRVYVGSTPPLERVYFAFARLDSTDLYLRHFRAPVDSESGLLGFEFVKGTLDKPLVYANRDLHNIVRNYLSAPGQQVEAPLDQRVRTVIHSLLPTQTLSIDRVAQSVACSERTLQRRSKKDFGVTYHKLVEEVRFDLARQLLAQSDMSIVNISLAVGYSNPANFARGFKDVFGCCPREWRKNQGGNTL